MTKPAEIPLPDSTHTRMVVGGGITLDVPLSTARDVTKQLDSNGGTSVHLPRRR